MQQRTVEPGHRFAGRYRLEDLLEDVAGVRSWRAIDELLGRAVLVQTVPLGDPRAAELAQAARAAAMSVEPRVLRVLDIATEDGHGYLVREWVVGTNLANLLAEGPLSPSDAGVLACEVAEALTSAHHQGLAHGCLDPTSVVVSPSGAVRVVGLATQAVIHPPSSADPAREDALGIGRILYAGLTGRWPGPGSFGLQPAPQVEGQFAMPRQVRAGVPRSLDEIVERLLADPSRRPDAIVSPSGAVEALSLVCPPPPASGVRRLSVSRVDGYDDSPPALVALHPADSVPGARDTTELPRVIPAPSPAPAPALRRWSRLLGVAAVGAFLLAIVLVGLQLINLGPDPAPPQTTPSATSPPTLTRVAVDRAVAYDPLGDGEENDRRAGNAIDGDPDTQWQTQTYFDPLEIQKAGVGLVLDLGSPTDLRQVQLILANAGGSFEIRVAVETAIDLPSQPDDWTTLVTRDDPPQQQNITFDNVVTTRYVLIWFTKLPQISSGEWRAAVTEVRVLG